MQDHGRYSELIARTNAATRKPSTGNLSISNPQARQTPSLVSFVGETGAGKSTIIRLLVALKASKLTRDHQLPVVGNPDIDIPTSDDVHLYMDPYTTLSSSPILYADCEGLDGGEQLPLAAVFRTKDSHYSTEQSHASQSTSRARFCSERELRWSVDPDLSTRDFVVSQFYSRLLFTFSDVIIFVQRNSR
jgi:hypothetical protein